MQKKLILAISIFFLILPILSFAKIEISDGSVKALYHLDDDLVDSSGNGLNLSWNGSSSFADAKLSRGIDLLGSTNYLDGGNILDFTNTDAFSIVFWLKPDNVTSDRWLYGKGIGGTGERGYGVRNVNSGRLQIFYINTATSNWMYGLSTASNVIATDDFYHIVIMKNTTDDFSGVSLFVNGIAEALTTSVDSLSATISNTDDFEIGAVPRSGSNRFDGIIDEFVILDRELTTDEITALYASGTGNAVCVTSGCADIVSQNLLSYPTPYYYFTFFLILSILIVLSFLIFKTS